jgi:hypothetical protein
MIISPPFLPQHPASGPDATWLDVAMDVGGFGDGAFPLGKDFAWHGGVHLTAPRDGNTRLPVCAIADGTVVYVRQPKPQNSNANDPLNYGGGWTDDGCVIVKHSTEIGENVTVEFFSISLHLKKIASGVAQGKKIWRKDALGEAGSLYGHAGRIHFEIVCDDGPLKAMAGRTTGALDTDNAGRTDSVFGNVYVLLPAGTPFYDSIPLPPLHVTPFTQTTPLPTPMWNSSKALVVAINLSRSSAQYTTCTLDGTQAGQTPAMADTALYDAAVKLAQSQRAVGRDAYELLRFGRVLEPLGDAADLSNWQQVASPDGQGWVDLHAEGTYAFSDADFPDWTGWRFIDDDTDNDSRCDSAMLVDLILQSDGGATQARKAEALGKVSGADVQQRLARTLCKFPTEWEKATVTARWQWLTQETPSGAGPMAGPYLQPADFPRFKAHAEALCFWEEANLGIPAKHWHFHPREFIGLFRQCGWLSTNEMFQLFPMTAMRKSGSGWVSEAVPDSKSLIASYCSDLNKACRRYGIVTPLRMAAFYANILVETGWFRALQEGIPKKKEVVNGKTVHVDNPPRYFPWIGRGFLQLTWPDNYVKYWRFIGKNVDDDLTKKLDTAQRKADREGSNAPLMAAETHVTADMRRWRDGIADADHPADATDSAGAYWAWSHASQYADAEPANQRASKTASGTGSHMYYTSASMGNVAATVNVGHPSTNYASVNGIVARFQAYNTCEVMLLDTPIFPGSSTSNEPQDYKPRRS